MKTQHKIVIGAAVALGIGMSLAGQIANVSKPPTVVYMERVTPDYVLTPGVINSAITQANISQTLCNPNWSTKSIRPPSSYTSALKVRQLENEYKPADPNVFTTDFEEDHLISLELGGNPTDPKNLWPESYKTRPNAKNKDAVENYLHKQICNGSMTLKAAQDVISRDWTGVYEKMMNNGALGSVSSELIGIDNDDQ